MSRFLATLVLLLPLGAAQAQSVTMPKELSVKAGRLAAVEVAYEGVSFDYHMVGEDADVFREYTDNPNLIRLRVLSYTEGKVTLVCWAVKGDKSAKGVCVITVGTPPDPKPKPDPDPKPKPDPKPTVFRVLIVHETGQVLPRGQAEILSSPEVRGYLNAKCARGKGPLGGESPEWRIFDPNVDLSKESDVWRGVMMLPRQSLPWIVIGDGASGYQGPLPATIAETMNLLRKYGG
jgi:hypothetical protein